MSLDADGYPEEESLCALRDYDLRQAPLENFMALLEATWWMPAWGFKRAGNRLELHTGGWSGNEETIDFLEANPTFWRSLTSERKGGHFTFDLARVGR